MSDSEMVLSEVLAG